MEELTDRQREILDFINEFREKNQCNLTMREIADNFGMSSANGAYEHLASMAKKGVIRLISNKARGYLVNEAWM